MNINELDILLVYDFHPDFFNIPDSRYLAYGPVIQPDTYKYRTIDLRYSKIFYIKHKNNDTWLNFIDNKLIFQKLQPDNYAIYKPPTIFFLEYVDKQTFIIYYSYDIYLKTRVYLLYQKNNNVDNFKMTDKKNATRFYYNTDVRINDILGRW